MAPMCLVGGRHIGVQGQAPFGQTWLALAWMIAVIALTAVAFGSGPPDVIVTSIKSL